MNVKMWKCCQYPMPISNWKMATMALATLATMATFAKTFDVDVSTGRPSASNEAYYHGETIEFRAVRGRSVVTNIEYAAIYYQTNGMGDVWWKTDGLTFHPTNDVGAASYRFFLEGRDDLGRDWHANGLLRLLPSPGFVPNAISPPVVALDFAQIEVSNAPWLTSYVESDPTVPAWAKATNPPLPGNYAAVSNAAMSAANATNDFVRKSGGTIAGTLSITNSQGDAETGAHLVVTGDSIDGPQGEVTIGPARFLGLDFYNWTAQRSEPSLDIYDVDKTYIHGKLFAVDEIRLDVTYPPLPEAKDPYLSMTSNGFRCVAMAYGFHRADGLGFDAEDLYHPFIEVSSTEQQEYTGYPLYKYKIKFPEQSGTVALLENISADNATFSNAVVSVGLGIDTNTVAAINALVAQGDQLPLTGGVTLGALLLAIAGAIAALQRNKADISQLRYSFNAVTVPSGQTPTIAGLSDRAINAMTLGASVTWASIIFPARTSGVRDFFLRLTIEGTTPPTLSFSEADGSAVAFDAADSGWANIQPGVNLLMFTDTAE